MKNGQEIGWKQAWEVKKFRSLITIGSLGLFIAVILWPIFLKHIEKRNGIVLHDTVLAFLPVVDLSAPIFACIWGAALVMLLRVIKQPKLFLMFLFSYLMLFTLRMLTIQLIPLDAPIGLLKLKDPISNYLYGNGGVFITKDLFFSGHTATLFLIYLFLERKVEKSLTFIASILVGIMVLFQHIHYSIDVLFAPLFAFGTYWVAKNLFNDVFYQVKTQCWYQIKPETITNK